MGNEEYSPGFFFFLNNFLDMCGDPNTFILTPQAFSPTVECKSWENSNQKYFVDGFVLKA